MPPPEIQIPGTGFQQPSIDQVIQLLMGKIHQLQFQITVLNTVLSSRGLITEAEYTKAVEFVSAEMQKAATAPKILTPNGGVVLAGGTSKETPKDDKTNG